MAEKTTVVKIQPEKKNGHRPEPAVLKPQAEAMASLAELPEGLSNDWLAAGQESSGKDAPTLAIVARKTGERYMDDIFGEEMALACSFRFCPASNQLIVGHMHNYVVVYNLLTGDNEDEEED